MKDLTNRIYKELRKKIIDWNRVEEYIISLGDAINYYDDFEEECILSQAYQGCSNGIVNVQLTELFLKHGFEVSANEGRNGASCLRALCWSSYDRYVLHVAERLLEVGADSTISADEEDTSENKGVLSSIAWKSGYWHTGDYDAANMFVAYYEMVDRQQKGKPYRGIRAFRDAVGETVTKVEKLNVTDYKGQSCTSYLLYCGEQQLVLSDHVEFYIDPYARQDAGKVEDVTEDFKYLLGARVKGLRYFNSSLAKISFDNGYAILVGPNDSMGIPEKGAWFTITTSGPAQIPPIGTPIESITMWENRSQNPRTTFYKDTTIVLTTKDEVYGLYSHSSKYGEGTVRAEYLQKNWISGLSRGIALNRITVKHIEYVGNAVKWISIDCDEGILYVVSDGFENIAFFLSETEIAPEEVVKVDSWTKGLKKIEFIENDFQELNRLAEIERKQ